MQQILNISRNQYRLLQNLQNILKSRQHYAGSTVYQFKIPKPVYYPDRQNEAKHKNSQLISENTAFLEKRKLPKDYYYKVLGLHKYATTQQIKAAYYALAKRFHPDAGGQTEKSKSFQDISNAYHILTDAAKRLEYDQLGAVKDEQTFLNSLPDVQSPYFKSPERKSLANPPKDGPEPFNIAIKEQKVCLTFLEAVQGIRKPIEFKYLKKCPNCNGKSHRIAGKTNPEVCRKCNGTGQITKKTMTYSSLLVCDQCNGKRYINRNNCEMCESRGFVHDISKLIVPVPAGAESGEVISVENPKTKHIIKYRVQVEESDYYKRIGNTIHTEKYITICDAILGGTVTIKGIHDDIQLKIDPGTESHTQITIRGKGIRTSKMGIGDHIVTIKIRIPRQLSMKQRQLVLALAKTEQSSI